MKRRLATGSTVCDRYGRSIIAKQSMMDMTGFLKVDETIMFVNRKGLLIELLSYSNDAFSLNLTKLFQRKRSHSNRLKI